MRSRARSVLTTERTLGAGPVTGRGTEAAYRAVAEGPGEPHAVRLELAGADGGAVDPAPEGPAIACLAHITDLHVTDAQSPARFEWVNREWRDPRMRELLTMQRPQEMLNTHAIAALVRTVNNVAAGPVTGADLRLTVMTGDAIDNTQRNELTNFLALLDGGTVRPDSGGDGYDGVQRPDWPGDICWKPDGEPGGDVFQSALGFPRRRGLLEQAVQPFAAEGLRTPWLGCYGNHEEVCQGVGVVTSALVEVMTGGRKTVDFPPRLDFDRAVDIFTEHPEDFTTGRAVSVTPDAARRPITRLEFIESHVRSGSHGFTSRSTDDGVAYYVRDEGDVRFITLDTVCDAGGADGSIDPAQLHWLERRLEESQSSFTARDGTRATTSHRDRYFVILSHHGFDTLSNPRGERRAAELLELLLRFENVVLWLNGHIHMNRIRPRLAPGRRHGFWEVTTSSLVDWPCQARLVEIYRTRSSRLAIACTMLDHDGEGLAGVHRELAANVPFNGFDSRRAGEPGDRNAILLLPAPF